ncbi:MAG: hypothetical protein WCO55_01085 [Candidatus Falkowbacteria bacterium]
MPKTSTVIISTAATISAFIVGYLLHIMLEPSGYPNPFKSESSRIVDFTNSADARDSVWLDPGQKFVSLNFAYEGMIGKRSINDYRKSLITRNMLPGERCDTFTFTTYITDLKESKMTIAELIKK